MNRLAKKLTAPGALILVLLLLTAFLASCGGSDPVTPPETETNQAPGTPAINTGAGAPANAADDVALGAQLHWTCADPDGDQLTYTVRFGTAATPPIVVQDQATASYSPAGLANETTYNWQITANDGETTTSSPVWSFTTAGVPMETVSTPAAPTGPATGLNTETLAYVGSGATSSMGHTLEYRFDWDDGLMSSWSPSVGGAKQWSTAGTYEVRFQARCADHPAVESAWSDATTVVISVPAETVDNLIVHGPQTGGVGDLLEFWAQGGASSLGHSTEAQFDWGDGTTSDWVPRVGGNFASSHVWTTGGTYEITATARCVEHPTNISVMSQVVSLDISDVETISTPTLSPATEGTIDLGSIESQNVGESVNSMGHDVEYQLDWGNGTMTEWRHGYGIPIPADVEGDLLIRGRARCISHPDVVSDWSATRLVHVVDLENISRPTISGPANGTTGEPVTFTASATSSHGHTLEYQLYWGVDYNQPNNPQGWTTPDNLTITWDAAANFRYVFVKARCVDHPDVESALSLYHLITISD